MIPVSIVLAVPLMAVAFAGSLRWRLIALGLSVPLKDAAVTNIGGTSVLIPWAVVLMFIGRFVIDLGFRSIQANRSGAVIRQITPLVFFFLYNIFLISYSPYLFPQISETMPGSAFFAWQNAVPLSQQPESFNQAVYFVVSVVFAATVAITIITHQNRRSELIETLVYAMFIGGTFWLYWHVAHFYFGVYFPDFLLHTDLHSTAWDQAIAGVPRPSGSFPEPSAVGVFYIPLQFYFFEIYMAKGRLRDLLAWFGSVLALLISTSSTAYAGMAMFAAWMVVRVIMGGATMSLGAKIPLRQLQKAAGFFILGAVSLVVTWVVFIDPEAAARIIEEQILDKNTSISFQQRSYANDLALEIFADTFGIGVGMGNHRPSSLILSLLCGVGVIGTGLFLYFVIDTGLRCLAANQGEPTPRTGLNWAVATSLGATFASMLIAGAELQSPALWILVGAAIAIGQSGRKRRVSRRRAMRRAPDRGFRASQWG